MRKVEKIRGGWEGDDGDLFFVDFLGDPPGSGREMVEQVAKLYTTASPNEPCFDRR